MMKEKFLLFCLSSCLFVYFKSTNRHSKMTVKDKQEAYRQKRFTKGQKSEVKIQQLFQLCFCFIDNSDIVYYNHLVGETQTPPVLFLFVQLGLSCWEFMMHRKNPLVICLFKVRKTSLMKRSSTTFKKEITLTFIRMNIWDVTVPPWNFDSCSFIST